MQALQARAILLDETNGMNYIDMSREAQNIPQVPVVPVDIGLQLSSKTITCAVKSVMIWPRFHPAKATRRVWVSLQQTAPGSNAANLPERSLQPRETSACSNCKLQSRSMLPIAATQRDGVPARPQLQPRSA